MINEITTPYHDSRMLPSFSLRQVDLPEILKWQVNGKYYLVLKVEMTGIRNRKDIEAREDQTKIEAAFQVLSVKPVGDKPIGVTAIEKKEFEDLVGRIKSGGE